MAEGLGAPARGAGGRGRESFSGPTDDSFEVSGIESTRAFGLIEERNPQATPDGATARLVFEAPGGQRLTDPSNRRVVTATLERLRTGDVQSVVDPFTVGTVSKDGRVAYATVGYTEPAVDLAAADKDALAAAVRSAEDAGLRRRRGRRRPRRPRPRPPTGEADRGRGGDRRAHADLRLAGRSRACRC